MAYSNTDFRGDGSGCTMWFGDLIDIKQIPGGGQDVYMRMPASELIIIAQQKNNPSELIRNRNEWRWRSYSSQN
ncbi:hypothetical protein F8388_025183 [Cannabis sativa]|uniref:Apple domain-containing protein n=1 Tax=Cannabis sativa TaxID=3483 RepID=A0A7J6FUX4_CANSA|nr:hypothetical protein F8388_025183 [Cannabis sativa]